MNKIIISSDSQGDLELILRNCFGCKKPFLNEKKLVSVECDGTKNYEYLTQSGIKAYDNLIDTVYGLQDIGVISNANNIVEGLDSIVSEEDY